jgi:N6-adenosine-specific RNA methylase IME4
MASRSRKAGTGGEASASTALAKVEPRVHSASIKLVAPRGITSTVLEPARLVTADIPWPYDNNVHGRGAIARYKTMRLDAIRNLELPPIADDAMLAMWVVGAYAEEAYGIMRAWGFEYCHAEVVWNKYRRCAQCKGAGVRRYGREQRLDVCQQCEGRGQFRMTGMGWTTAWAHERAIFGVRGKGRKARLEAGILSAFDALMPTTTEGRLIHSAKPHEFYDRLAALFPGPRYALFERHHRNGYVCFGDELPPVIGEHEFANAPELASDGGDA